MTVSFGTNALSRDTIATLLTYVEGKKKDFAWGSNFLMWQPTLTIATGVVLTHGLPGEMADRIYNELVERKTLPYFPAARSIMFYSWFPGSSITWHTDYEDKNSMTIYLCKDWDPNHGGEFCWRDWDAAFSKHGSNGPPDVCRMRRPSFNEYVYMTDAEWHATTITAPSAPPRLTLQMFFAKPGGAIDGRQSESVVTIGRQSELIPNDEVAQENGSVMDERVSVTLLLRNGHQRRLAMAASDPALKSLLEVLAKRNDEKLQSTVFNLEIEDGAGSLVFGASDLVALTSEPPLSVEVETPGAGLSTRRSAAILGEPWPALGLVEPSHNPVGTALALADLAEARSRDLILLHCPVELSRYGATTVGRGGALVRSYLNELLEPSPNPEQVLIDFDLRQSLKLADARVFDLGNILFSMGREPANAAWARCAEVLTECFHRRAVPVLLGGDHTVTYAALEALNRVLPAFGVIHFDAHHDFYASGDQGADSTLTHGNVFHFARRLSGLRHLFQIGLRDVYRPAPNARPVGDGILPEFVSAREAAQREPEAIIAGLRPELPYYVTFDVDVLDLARRSGTATPLRGGLSRDVPFDLLRAIFARIPVCGLDFVEIAESEDGRSETADFAARAVLMFLFSLRSPDPLSSYVFS